ncbi:ATP-grasp domain-containing protein [Neorhizobium sp. CSC1952]|uniref:ATP-grasp domain-containing protein n=1 Tax=Neorhizobium sp. CSC1952 TaxID=2978974 RepID=UPI0025A62A69|nr:ATP-grasp domain-containing protein [Rhizobium sp. CSC1952]WJR65117.1 ATP-grasp domain-containing protein [Rhizobium sp. CSC1952]
MPAASKNNPALLIAAISGRSLAAAARRAGYRPLVADLFGDSDTVALADRIARLPGSIRDGIGGEKIVDTLTDLARGEEPVALVYGSGFERRPDIIDTLAGTFRIAGNSAAAIRAVKDPIALSRLCWDIGIRHPAIRFSPPFQQEGWLTKLGGGAGGSHVRPAGTAPLEEGYYYQKFVEGCSISALFLAQAGRAHVVGFSRQWSSPSQSSPFRYGGAVRLMRFDREKRAEIACWLDRLTKRTGLVGLCSADFIDGPDGLHLIEINPRPGATLDIFDNEDAPLLAAHLNAVRGDDITVPTYSGTTASAIAYAPRAISRFPDVDWPNMTADHQNPGSALSADDPVCTVLAKARSATAAERAVKRRVNEMAEHWKENFQ